MTKQQAITGTPKQFQRSLWKRMALVSALLSGGSLALLVSTQTAYASPISTGPTSSQQPTQNKTKVIYLTNIVITCIQGNGGKGGKAIDESGGAYGGNGGSCTVNIPIKISLTENNTVLQAKIVANANTVGNAQIVRHAGTVSSANTVSKAKNVSIADPDRSTNTSPSTNIVVQP